jgi:hypothetical protein
MPMMSSVNHPNARAAPPVYVRIGENGIDRTGFGKWARVIEVKDNKALLKFKVGDQSHDNEIPDQFQYLEIDLDRCQLTDESEHDHKPDGLDIPQVFTGDERYHFTLYPTTADRVRREEEEDALYND